MPSSTYELAFLPYIALRNTDSVEFGEARLWNFSRQSSLIADEPLRQRVGELLAMYRDQAGEPARSRPLHDIGVISIGPADFRPFTRQEFREASTLRFVLFLCCLSDNLSQHGPNTGHAMYTAENFDMILQRFVLESDGITESSGVILQRHLMGYKIGVAQFPTPSFVNRPGTFRFDHPLFRELSRLRRSDRRLYDRIIRSASVFLGSYYNSHSLGLEARVLLQTSAFEVLLDLPEKDTRHAFKDIIEGLLNTPNERRYQYKFETRKTRRAESRSLKGIWADRFYTLRNHLIHGAVVRTNEFVFRGSQHHLFIAPLMFVSAIKRLIDRSRAERGKQTVFFDKCQWAELPVDDDDEVPRHGFRIVTDFGALLAARDYL
jgi:hypothetical protein